ncbi:MAG: hypothetical protein V4714_15565 [Bacteroidota bacterium]
MNTIPEIIGEAKVIWYAEITKNHYQTGNTQHFVAGKVQAKADGLAI